MNLNDSTNGNGSLPIPPPPRDVVAVAIEALRTIGSDVATGIANLEKLGRTPFPPGPPMPLAAASVSRTPAPSSQPDLAEVFKALEIRLRTDPDLQKALGENVAALDARFASYDVTPAGQLMMRAPNGGGTPTPTPTPRPVPHPTSGSAGIGPYPTQPPTTAEAFWWGFHIVIPHEAMVWLDTAFGLGFIGDAAAVGAVVGPAIAAGASIPIAGWALFAAFAALMIQWGICHACDKGNGIYFSMLWVAPGVFVPTTR